MPTHQSNSIDARIIFLVIPLSQQTLQNALFAEARCSSPGAVAD
jgi:hypothetical protein